MSHGLLAEAATPGAATVRVDLAGRSYDIEVGRGVLAGLGTALARLAPGSAVAVVTDESVGALHLPGVMEQLQAAGIRATSVVLPVGERTKSFAHLEMLCDAVIAARLERRDVLVALGGGVIGDLTGFAAAILRRGMRFVQVPTSLLAQVDSSVGGKTAINASSGKNLIGAFHQPSLVLADTALLDTLSPRHMRAGYAEVFKYGLIDQEPFFRWLEGGAWQGIFAGGPEREEAVRVSCAAKAAVVARDETETGDRALLNLGHTFGHALEAVTGYDGDRLVHGEAIAIGQRLAFDFSVALGLCPPEHAVRVRRHIEAVGLPTRLVQVPGGVGPVDGLLAAIAQDKKVTGGTLTFILARGIGRSFIARDVPAERVRAFLAEELAAEGAGP
jgi:3-dehydroquinate synthase